MTPPRYDARRDLRILQAMAPQVERYLIEDELFWPIAGRGRGGMPRLTLGGFLLRQHRLDGLRDRLTPAQQARLDEVRTTFAAAQGEWAIHYNKKLAREWDWRVGMLQTYLKECEEAEERALDCADDWRNQAEHRTVLHHMRGEFEARNVFTDQQKAELKRIDSGLRRYLLPGEAGVFLWADDLARVYPREIYWWLWVAPCEDEET